MLTRIVRYVFLAVIITNATGCSLFIDAAGVSPAALGTQELVHKKFGKPQRISTIRLQHSTGETRDFEVEHYIVHWKVASELPELPVQTYCLLTPIWESITTPIWESITTPIFLLFAIDEIVRVHSLEFVYDDEGKTIGLRYPSALMGPPTSSEEIVYVGEWTDPSRPESQSLLLFGEWREQTTD